MVLVRVPKPPKSAYDPNRPMSSLLRSQVDHLQEAEAKLPLQYCSRLYAKAIRTEAEAARYIREVTEGIHRAHEDAARSRKVGKAPARRRVIEIAAVADERPHARARKRRAAKGKKTSAKKKRKK
jgi:hypothetical protein